MSSDPVQQGALTPVRRRGKSLLPPRWLWIVLLAVTAVLAALHGTDVLADHATLNVLTLVLAFLALIVLLVWFGLLSGYRRRTRLLGLAGCLAAVGLLAALFRVDRVSGELVPSFALRFARKPDRLLESLMPGRDAGDEGSRVDLSTTTAYDFPQFLGPERSASARGVKLARDWASRPVELVWRQAIGAGWSAFSVVNGHAVTMEQRGEEEMVTCYHVETGRLEWFHSSAARYEALAGGVGPRSTPTVDEGMVYALGATGRLLCLDGATGRCRWEKNLLEEYGITPEEESAAIAHGRANSPLVVGDLVVVPAGGPKAGRRVSLVAYDKRLGTRVWEGGGRQISYSSPAVGILGGVEQILIVNEESASGHDAKTGKVLWEHPWKARSNADPNVAQAVPVPPDRVFLSKGYGRGGALLRLVPRGNGTFAAEVVWENSKVMRTKFTNVAIKDGYVYGLSDGILECIELTSGRRAWKEGRYRHGQILRAGDLLLVLSEAGEVALVEATPDRANHVLGRFQAVEGMTWNNLALYGPYLLVRSAQEAACYRLPWDDR